jgi:hypothetical protein
MKSKSLLFFSLLIGGSLSAQITITSAELPSVGDTYIQVAVSTVISPGPAGANQTWDFSSLSGTATPYGYVSLAASQDQASFPNANLVEGVSGAENYFKKNATEFSIEGQFVVNSVRSIFTDSKEFYVLPITYNDVFNETFSGSIENIAQGQTFTADGTVQITADGHGTLILPYGTVTDVLRIRTTYEYDIIFQGIPFYGINDTIYTWRNLDNNATLASHTVSYTDNTLSLESMSYLDQSSFSTTGVNELATAELFSMYPNPATSTLTVVNSVDNGTVTIFDMSGRMVHTQAIATETEQVDVADLPAGMYMVQVANSKFQHTELLVIE